MSPDRFFQPLTDVGLNLQAVFDRAQLPEDLWEELSDGDQHWTQLVMVGHAGQRLWEQVQQQPANPHPIDHFSARHVADFFNGHLPGHRYRLLYPSPRPLSLLRLGALAGWHHPSPLRLGVCTQYGSWFAYRALVITDTRLSRYSTPIGSSACDGCASKPCVSACPAEALQADQFVEQCRQFRLQSASPCAENCPARAACPAGREHAYSDAQNRYHYRQSLGMLKRLQAVLKN